MTFFSCRLDTTPTHLSAFQHHPWIVSPGAVRRYRNDDTVSSHAVSTEQNYTVGQKTAPFYFCNNFLYSNKYWYTYTLIKVLQDDIKIIDLL